MTNLYTTGEMIDALFKEPNLVFIDTTKLFFARMNASGVFLIEDKFGNVMPHLSMMDKDNAWLIYTNPDEKEMNYETELVYKRYINVIDEILYMNPELTNVELSCMLSEKIEDDILEQLSGCSEGFISDVIGESLGRIVYLELIERYKKYNG